MTRTQENEVESEKIKCRIYRVDRKTCTQKNDSYVGQTPDLLLDE